MHAVCAGSTIAIFTHLICASGMAAAQHTSRQTKQRGKEGSHECRAQADTQPTTHRTLDSLPPTMHKPQTLPAVAASNFSRARPPLPPRPTRKLMAQGLRFSVFLE